MLILLHLDTANTLAVKAFRLQVKERLYRFNFVRFCLTIHDNSLTILHWTMAGGLSPTRRPRKAREAGRNLSKRHRRLPADSRHGAVASQASMCVAVSDYGMVVHDTQIDTLPQTRRACNVFTLVVIDVIIRRPLSFGKSSYLFHGVFPVPFVPS